MSQWVVDASLTLQWYLKDEEDRDYGLAVLAGLRENETVVPFLWDTKYQMRWSWPTAASGLS